MTDGPLDCLSAPPPFRWTLSPAQMLVQVHFAQNTLKFDKAADFGLIEHYVWNSSNLPLKLPLHDHEKSVSSVVTHTMGLTRKRYYSHENIKSFLRFGIRLGGFI
jgi:hypothetical protein